MSETVFDKDSKLVEVKYFIYPRYDIKIERELLEYGITHLFSVGKIRLNYVNVIGKGKTGIVALLDEKRVIKIRRSDAPKETLRLEAEIQKMAYPSAPKVHFYGDNFIVMEYISQGRYITREDTKYLPDLIIRAKHLEDVKIEHHEISRPWKNVLVDGKRSYIIDYDSASIKENPHNVNKILSAFGYTELATKYKRGLISFDKILDFITEKEK